LAPEGEEVHAKRTLVLALALVAGWLAWSVANVAGWFGTTKDGLAAILLWTVVDTPCGFLVSLLLIAVYARLQRRVATPGLSVLLGAGLCLLAAFCWNSLTPIAYAALEYWLHGWLWSFAVDWKDVFLRTLSRTLAMGLICLLYFAVDHWYQLAEQRRRARDAAALAQQAELQMLRYQLNPHFLFNALNSIRALILKDPPRARQMVTELAAFFRSSLDRRREENTIGDELAALASYLAIQRIRFEDRLLVRVHADPEALQAGVPCFLIHPLVENAVKHGMRTSPMPLRIDIDVARRDRELEIRVSNTGRLLPAREGAAAADDTGTGLENVCRRLRLAFAGRHSFRIVEADGWVRAEIQLQLGPA
jgi:two-component system LytT family sensor kinase